MNIYEIGQDFDNYKFFVFKEDDESNKGVWDYNGQSLINEWKGLSLELFRDKRKTIHRCHLYIQSGNQKVYNEN